MGDFSDVWSKETFDLTCYISVSGQGCLENEAYQAKKLLTETR